MRLFTFSTWTLVWSAFWGNPIFAMGGMEGGGGKGVLCGALVRSLDLYEAEKLHHWPIPINSDDIETILANYGIDLAYYNSETGFDRSNLEYKKLILNMYKEYILEKFVDIPIGSRLPFTPDATLPSLPSECSFVQIVIFSQDGTLYRDRALWNRLSIIDQAALVIHEALYYEARQQGALLSDDTRNIVGRLFAQKLPSPVLEPIWNQHGMWWCSTQPVNSKNLMQENFEFFVVDEDRNAQQGVGIYFNTFKNYSQYERTSSFFKGLRIRDFFIGKANFDSLVHSHLSGLDWTMEYTHDRTKNLSMIRANKQGEPKTEYSVLTCELKLREP